MVMCNAVIIIESIGVRRLGLPDVPLNTKHENSRT